MIALTVTIQREAPLRFLRACEKGGLSTSEMDIYHNEPNVGVVRAYHKLWEKHSEEDYLLLVHDDVSIHDSDWVRSVAEELDKPKVAIVGFGGAIGIGDADIYKTRYDINQLARISYASNQTDWGDHGWLETGSREVAVVDGFFMGMNGAFLREVGGWNWIKSNFHCYDTAMCLEAYRRGWNVRMVGVNCTHHGGGTSISPEYAEWCKERGTTMEREHQEPHRWLYDKYRDILPFRI